MDIFAFTGNSNLKTLQKFLLLQLQKTNGPLHEGGVTWNFAHYVRTCKNKKKVPECLVSGAGFNDKKE